jgi:hypothetical protein
MSHAAWPGPFGGSEFPYDKWGQINITDSYAPPVMLI